MFDWLTRRKTVENKATEIYGAVVAHARNASLFGEHRIADTMVGRYEAIVLHMFLVMERMRVIEPEPQAVLRAVVERFVTDVDDCMREIGVSDLKVGGHVKKAAAGLYERIAIYRAAINEPNAPEDALQSSLITAGVVATDATNIAAQLADYMKVARAALAQQSDEQILSGSFSLPQPKLS